LNIKNRKGKTVTSDEYTTVRVLIDAGLPDKIIREVTGRSLFTLAVMKKFPHFEDYRAYIIDYAVKVKARKTGTPVEEKVNEVKESPVTEQQVLVLLAEINKSVSSINKNLEVLGNFLVKRVNKETLKKSKFFSFGN
jgi:hypothetical protein